MDRDDTSTRLRASLVTWLACACLGAVLATGAWAQGAGRSMDLSTSVRAMGMGGASAGVAWGDPDVWGNVASLSRVTGVHWEQTTAQLVPGLATDVWFHSRREMLGGGGVGVSLMGVPFRADGVRLSYGTSDQTDQGGNLIDQFQSYETVRGEALGISVPALVAYLGHADGGAAAATRAFDVSLGVAGKRTFVSLAPSYLQGTASAQSWDFGVQARLSPLELMGSESAKELRQRMLLDVGAGIEGFNASSGRFVFLSEDVASPATQMWREGIAARAGMRLPMDGFDPQLRRFLSGCNPLFALSLAYDHDDGNASSHGWTVDHTGLELTIANVFTFRHGRYVDHLGGIDGDTSGWGVGLPVGPWGGFRYDEAKIPQARDSDLPDRKQTGWVAWLDVVRAWNDLGLAGGHAGAAH